MKRILIVEDQADIRDLIRMTMEFEDFEVHEAADGATGLHTAAKVQPHLILLDVMMPGDLDGIAVCERLRRDPQLKRVKVVMLSAKGQASDRQAGLNAGADHYLIKPFSPRQLLDVVTKLI